MSRNRRVKSAYWQPRWSIWFYRGLQFILLPFSILMCVALIGYVKHAGYFSVHAVTVTGNIERVDQAQLQSAIIDSVHGTFFTVDIKGCRQAVLGVPWVKRAVVRRVWPDSLVVRVEGNQPIARWGKNKVLVDSGELLPDHLSKSMDIPVFTGPDDSSSAVYAMYQELSERLSSIQLKVAGLAMSSRGEWQLTTNTGMVLRLGHDHVVSRLERFAQLYPTLVVDRPGVIGEVDLRYRNGVAVRWGNK